MDEYNNVMPDNENNLGDEPLSDVNECDKELLEELSKVREDVSYLRDLFVRRLNDDKQKNTVIQKLAEGATYAFTEPFLHDIILLLDRLEKSDDDFVMSVAEELYDIIKRRGVERINVTFSFDPSLHKAVKVIDDPSSAEIYISGIVRNGYLFSGKVLRPAEVIVGRPAIAFSEENIENG